MGAYTGPLKFQLRGVAPDRFPTRLVWDSHEVVYETLPNDVDNPDKVQRRRVLTVDAHVDVAAVWTTSTAFDDFINQQQIANPVMEFPSVRGDFVRHRKFSNVFDILRNTAARIGDGNIARISLTLQTRQVYEPKDDNTGVT